MWKGPKTNPKPNPTDPNPTQMFSQKISIPSDNLANAVMGN